MTRSANGAIVHSRAGDKGRNERTAERSREDMHNIFGCALAGDQATYQGGRFDCAMAKAQREAKRLTPDYIRK